MALPPTVIDAIADICEVIADNPSLRNGAFRAPAAQLAKRIEKAVQEAKTAAASGLPDAVPHLELDGQEIKLAVDMAEAVALAIVNGSSLIGSRVLMRVCERVVDPITDALGYREL